MNYKYTSTPEDYAGFFFSENKITNPQHEYIIHLSFPRFMLKWEAKDGMFANFEQFYKSVAELQWLDGIEPSEQEKERLLITAWNFLCIEDKILEDDLNEMEDDEDF